MSFESHLSSVQTRFWLKTRPLNQYSLSQINNPKLGVGKGTIDDVSMLESAFVRDREAWGHSRPHMFQTSSHIYLKVKTG